MGDKVLIKIDICSSCFEEDSKILIADIEEKHWSKPGPECNEEVHDDNEKAHHIGMFEGPCSVCVNGFLVLNLAGMFSFGMGIKYENDEAYIPVCVVAYITIALVYTTVPAFCIAEGYKPKSKLVLLGTKIPVILIPMTSTLQVILSIKYLATCNQSGCKNTGNSIAILCLGVLSFLFAAHDLYRAWIRYGERDWTGCYKRFKQILKVVLL